METVGQVLNQVIQEKQSDLTVELSIKEIAELPMFATPSEAKNLDYKLLEPVPEPIKCEFCNQELEITGRRAMMRREIIQWHNYQECQCEKAEEKRHRLFQEQLDRQIEEEILLRKAEFNAKVERLFQQSKLGERFKTRTFKNYQVNEQNKHAYDTTLKYANEFHKYKPDGIGLILNGSYGTGKTHLAAAITIELIKQGTPVIFGTTITLLGKLKQSYEGEIKETESEIIDLYSTIDLLVIDDLGKERINEWVLEKLYLIINSRYENNLPIVVTTNYSIEDLTKKLSTTDKYGSVINRDTAEAITSRLWEMCRGIEMVGADWRKQ